MESVVWMRNTLHLMIEKQKRIRFDDRQKNAFDLTMGGGVGGDGGGPN